MNTKIQQEPAFDLVISSSGLDAERQIEIREAFAPFAARVADWASKIALVDDPKVARETRLAMRRERIDLDKKHAEFKSKTLAWTRAVDGSKKVISDAYDSMESQMEEIEKAEERRIAAEKAARKAERDARRAAMMHRSKHFTSLSRPPSSGLTKKPEALTSGQTKTKPTKPICPVSAGSRK